MRNVKRGMANTGEKQGGVLGREREMVQSEGTLHDSRSHVLP